MTKQGSFPLQTDEPLVHVNASIVEERRIISLIEGELHEHEKALARLLRSRDALKGKAERAAAEKKPRERSAASVVKTAAQRAGVGNMAKARDLLRHNGPTTKAQVTKLMAINDGTVTYALRALEEAGEVRKTGERVHGSDVYEYVSKTRAVSRPGGRR